MNLHLQRAAQLDEWMWSHCFEDTVSCDIFAIEVVNRRSRDFQQNICGPDCFRHYDSTRNVKETTDTSHDSVKFNTISWVVNLPEQATDALFDKLVAAKATSFLPVFQNADAPGSCVLVRMRCLRPSVSTLLRHLFEPRLQTDHVS